MDDKKTKTDPPATGQQQGRVNEPMGAQQPPYPPYYGYTGYPPVYRREESSKPKIAGALLIAAAILGLIFGTMLIGFGGFVMADMDGMEMKFPGNVDISGRVISSNGSAIANATVSINGTHLSTSTDNQGHYALLGVPTGVNDIIIEKDGYTRLVYRTFTVPDNSQFNFTMSPGTGTRAYGSTEMSMIRMGMMVFGVVAIICSAAALVGGIFALKRQYFGLVIACTVAAIFSIGFCLGSIFAVVALLVLLLSAKEFKKQPAQPAQG